MSQFKFDPQYPSIVLTVYLEGKIMLSAKFILDTGASFVVVPWWLANGLGLMIDPRKVLSTTTASSVETVPYTIIPKITVLGKAVKDVTSIVKDLPSESEIDGLLGLSFLRNFKMLVDFKKGILNLE